MEPEYTQFNRDLNQALDKGHLTNKEIGSIKQDLQ